MGSVLRVRSYARRPRQKMSGPLMKKLDQATDEAMLAVKAYVRQELLMSWARSNTLEDKLRERDAEIARLKKGK